MATLPENRSAACDANKAEETHLVEKYGSYRLPLDRISRNRFHFESASGLPFFCVVPASRWSNKNGK